MAKVNISNVEVLDTDASFLSPFRMRITFECYEPLEDDLEWQLIYVSSAYNVDLDQTLDSILVGPVPVGKHQFLLETDPPNTDKIPVEDAVGVTVVIVACLYRNQEFIRVGYYVNNEYEEEELRENPPERPVYDKLMRRILADNPRVTRRGIDWGDGRPTASEAEVAVAEGEAAFAQPEAPAESHLLQQSAEQQQSQQQQPQQQQSSESAKAGELGESVAKVNGASGVVAKENCAPAVGQ